MSQWGLRGRPALGRLFVLSAVLWLAGPTSGRAAVQGEWVVTGSPIAGSASGGTVIVRLRTG